MAEKGWKIENCFIAELSSSMSNLDKLLMSFLNFNGISVQNGLFCGAGTVQILEPRAHFTI